MTNRELVVQHIQWQAMQWGVSLPEACMRILHANLIQGMPVYAIDYPAIFEQLKNRIAGAPYDAARLTVLCGNHSDLMAMCLSDLGVHAPGIAAVARHADERNGYNLFSGHSLNEVNDPYHGAVVYDADFGVYFIDKKTGRRASMADLVSATNLENEIEPHNPDNYVGWDQSYTRGGTLATIWAMKEADYYCIMMSPDSPSDPVYMRSRFMLCNRTRVDIDLLCVTQFDQINPVPMRQVLMQMLRQPEHGGNVYGRFVEIPR